MRQDAGNGNYESIGAFLRDTNAPATNPDNESVRADFANDGNHSPNWYGAGCATGNAVQDKVNNGWKEGRDRLNELRSKINTVELTPQDRRRRRTRSDTGDTLDMGMVYAGRLDIAWTVAKRQTTQGPQKIELCANMICSGGEHADVLFWRGAAATVLADMLETSGYMVRLVVCFGGKICDSGEKISCRIVVKEHGMPFDISSVSATILPGFFRALGHAWAVGHVKKRNHSPSMSVLSGTVEPNEILVSHNVRDHGTAVAFINETIAKINGHTLAA